MHKLFFRQSILLPAFSIFIIIHLWTVNDHNEMVVRFALSVAALALLLTPIAMIIEAIIGYAVLGDYPGIFHRLGNDQLRNLRLIMNWFLAFLFAGTAATITANELFSGFCCGIPHIQEDVGTCLISSVYYVTTTFATVGYGDIVPANGFGQLVAIMLELYSVGFITMFLTRAIDR